MSTTQFSVRTPQDAAALAPVVLGFVPSRSVVMFTFGGQHPFHARIDMPGINDYDTCAAALIEPCRQHGVQRVVLQVWPDPTPTPWEGWAVADALLARFTEAGIEVVATLLAGETWLWATRDGEAEPFDLMSHPYVAESVLKGRVIEPGRSALAERLAYRPGLEAPIDLSALDLDVAEQRELLLRPGPGRTDWLDRLAATLASLPDGDPRMPHMAGLVAFHAWQAGQGALAWTALDRAGQHPTSMCLLMEQILANAVSPEMWQEVNA